MDEQTAEQLVDGTISWEELRDDVLPDPKDPDRFRTITSILQNRVDFDDPILIPMNDHLYAVAKDGERVVKGACGHEFCELGDNWKTHAQMRVRETKEEWSELHPEPMTGDPDWQFQLREFFCPECYQLLSVDPVPRGYPVQVEFEPDIDTFYEDWLGEPVPE